MLKALPSCCSQHRAISFVSILQRQREPWGSPEEQAHHRHLGRSSFQHGEVWKPGAPFGKETELPQSSHLGSNYKPMWFWGHWITKRHWKITLEGGNKTQTRCIKWTFDQLGFVDGAACLSRSLGRLLLRRLDSLLWWSKPQRRDSTSPRPSCFFMVLWHESSIDGYTHSSIHSVQDVAHKKRFNHLAHWCWGTGMTGPGTAGERRRSRSAFP